MDFRVILVTYPNVLVQRYRVGLMELRNDVHPCWKLEGNLADRRTDGSAVLQTEIHICYHSHWSYPGHRASRLIFWSFFKCTTELIICTDSQLKMCLIYLLWTFLKRKSADLILCSQNRGICYTFFDCNYALWNANLLLNACKDIDLH